MPTWQARAVALLVRAVMRRQTWGDERALARRARRVFGPPRAFQWLRTRDVRIEAVRHGAVRGEWVTAACSDRGVVLYFHGGGYVAGSPATDRPITAALARLAGRRVFSLDYRLAPEHRFPAAVDDAIGAYRWLLGHGVAPRALALAGQSAGGGLVLATLLRLRDEGVPLPAAAVCISPWTDLAGTGASLHGNDGRCATFRPGNIADFARAYVGDGAPLSPYASPVLADFHGLPPVLFHVGSIELLLDDARRVHEKILRAGGASRLEVFDGLFHSWHMMDGVVPEARAALERAAAFVNEAGGREGPQTPTRSEPPRRSRGGPRPSAVSDQRFCQ
ncbi:MAG: alpha/beta hydrolase [Candidatus Rokubacteria bacterium]|nr:alpha/beta hydrolase [Candidatus Rokubacteria bacterium]